jgi:L-alanine-DL-glutamate epimerase-like enolase superfamily enzyme
MLRLRSLTAIPVSVPLKKPVKMAGSTLIAADNVIVRAEDESGAVGWGESASAPMMNGETQAGMVAAIRHMAERLSGAEVTEVASLPHLIGPTIHFNPGAKAAVEIALLDLIGQKTGQPLHALLGGRQRERAAALIFIAGGTLEEEVAEARRLVADGVVALKVKIGILGVEMDLARCAAVRAAVGPGIRVSADANMGYARDEALAFCARAAETGIDFVEQPVAEEDLATMADCASLCGVPVAADEGLHSIDQIRRHHETGAAAGGSLKTIKLGGALAVMEAGHLMQRLGMRVNLAGKTAETGIASAAIAHLAVALPQVDWDTSMTAPYLAADIVTEPVTIRAGHIAPPEGPGLGIRVDGALLARFIV